MVGTDLYDLLVSLHPISTDLLEECYNYQADDFFKAAFPPPVYDGITYPHLVLNKDPSVVAQELLNFLAKEWKIEKAKPEKYTITAWILPGFRLNNGIVSSDSCKMKVRIMQKANDEGTIVNFQRREGDSVVFEQVVSLCCEHMKTIFLNDA